VSVVAGLVAVWAVTADWWARYLDTALHEGGHALTAWAHGWGVDRVHIERGGGGFTDFGSGRQTPAGVFIVFSAGYTSPPLAGLGSAALLAAGNTTAVLVLAVVALVGLMLVVENRFGVGVILLSAAGLVGLARYSPHWLALAAAYFLTWFLLLSGVKSVHILRKARAQGTRTSDADVLARLTHLPAPLWVLAFAAVSLWCLIKGAALLL
jgi:hypothetical protein